MTTSMDRNVIDGSVYRGRKAVHGMGQTSINPVMRTFREGLRFFREGSSNFQEGLINFQGGSESSKYFRGLRFFSKVVAKFSRKGKLINFQCMLRNFRGREGWVETFSGGGGDFIGRD